MYRYGGHVVAKLPFEPFTLLAKIAHRGLDSPAANDCSVVSDPLLPWQRAAAAKSADVEDQRSEACVKGAAMMPC